MFCRFCLYDLSRTREPRCPECGCWFDPERREATTLPTSGRLAWLWHHAERVLLEGWLSGGRSGDIFCRACFHDLRNELEDRCPACGTRFNRKDSSTFRRRNDAFTRLHERFRHICLWRGVLIPLVPLWIGAHALVTGRTFLPGRVSMLVLEDWSAVAMGIAWLGAAIALHAHFFWGRVEPVWRFAGLGTLIGVLAIIGGWGGAIASAVAATMG